MKKIIWIVAAIVGTIVLLSSLSNKNRQSTETRVLGTTPAPNSSSEVIETDTFDYSPSFNGYRCTQDCSGHEAGYEWAEEKGIENVDDCGGNSQSFIEGCQSYVEENYPNYSNGYDSEDY